MWFGTALFKTVRLKFEITPHSMINAHSHEHAAILTSLIAHISGLTEREAFLLFSHTHNWQ